MSNLFTVGYQGDIVRDLIERLKKAKIKAIVDVRENPISRKPGFSKYQLSRSLREEGIDYFHYQELGTPKPLRNFLENNKDYHRFFEQYDEYLSQYEDSLGDLVELGSKEKICLLCFEKDAEQCHRKAITDYIKNIYHANVNITHL